MNRSTLYSIEPIGIGSHKVESLTSYIGRIAAAHSVTTGNLLNKVINTLLKKDYIDKVAHRGGNGFYKSTNAINGNGCLARDFLNAMEELTTRNDLISTTLLTFSDVLPMRNLIKSYRSWCPYCFNDMRTTEVIYEPLIWSIAKTTQCNEHKCSLVNKCPNCSKQQTNLARSYVPGYCNSCFDWLGSSYPVKNNIKYTDSTIVVIEDLLKSSYLESKKKYKAKNIVKSIKLLVNSLYDDNVTLAARSLGFSKSTFYGWYTGKNIPTLSSIAEICVKLDIDILELVKGDIKLPLNIQKTIDNNVRTIKKRRSLNHYNIKNKLDEVIEGTDIVSLKKIANDLDCDRRLISRKFPIECSKIKEENLLKLNAYKEQRKEHLRVLVSAAIKETNRHNKYPSIRTIEKLIGIGYLREKEIKEVYMALKGSS